MRGLIIKDLICLRKQLVIFSYIVVSVLVISFADFGGIIVSAASLMGIYVALVIVFRFLFGHGKENYAIIISWILIIMSAVLVNINKIRKLFSHSEAEDAESMKVFAGFLDFIKHRSYVLLAAALITIAASYFASVRIAKRKRGVV